MNNKKRNTIIWIITGILLFIAWLLRINRSGVINGWIRCFIQSSLLFLWILSINNRIMNKNAKRYLICIGILYILWTILVMTKYTVLKDYLILNRYAWYSYYIPLTIVPVLLVFIGNYVGQKEEFKMNIKWYFLLIPSIISIILVLTNNFHELVFSFPNGLYNDNGYKQNFIWFIIIGLIAIEIIYFLILLIKNCRLNKKGYRIILPLIPLLLLLVYAIIYIVDYDIIKVVAGDMKSVNVYAVVFTLELLISSSLLPTNSNYKELFEHSSLPLYLVDNDLNLYLKSNNDISVNKEEMRKSINSPIMLDNNYRLSSMSIQNGYILYAEDVYNINELISEIKELNEELKHKNIILKNEVETNQKAESLIQKNRLYNRMQEETKGKIFRLETLIDKLEQDLENKDIIIKEILIVLSYLKRRNNLLFIEEEDNIIMSSELEYSIKESLTHLNLFNVDSSIYVTPDKPLKFGAATKLYDVFENIIEKILDNISSVYVSLIIDDNINLRLNISSSLDLETIFKDYYKVIKEDINEWIIEYTLKEDKDE